MKKQPFILKKFNSLLATATVSIAVSSLLQVSDSVIAGSMLGEQSLAAVNVVAPLYVAALFLANLISTGAVILFSNAAGAFEEAKMKQYFSEGLIFTLLICILISVFVFFGKNLYFQFFHLSPSAEYLADKYFRYYKYVYILMPLFLYLSETVYAEGDELICNISYFVNVFGNISVSILMCRLWGIQGIGFGSLVGTVLSLLVLLGHFLRKTNALKFAFYLHAADLLHIMRYSVLDASAYLYFAAVSVCLNKYILLHFGEYHLPVYTTVFSLIELEVVLDGIGGALSPLINVYRGEKNRAGEKKVLKYGFRAAVAEGLILSAFFFLLAPFFTRTAFGIADPVLYRECILAIRIIALRAPVTSVLFALSSYYLLSDRILLGSVLICLNNALMPIALGITLASTFGLAGLWIGYALSPALSLLLLTLYIRLRYGKEMDPLLLEKPLCKSYTYDLELTPEEIITLRNSVERDLLCEQLSPGTLMTILLLCEDYLMLVRERNGGKALRVECSLLIDEQVSLIFRDEGKLINLANENLNITSLRSMVVSSLMERIRSKGYLVTTSSNRNLFRFNR